MQADYPRESSNEYSNHLMLYEDNEILKEYLEIGVYFLFTDGKIRKEKFNIEEGKLL